MSGFVKRNRSTNTANPAGGVNPAKTPNVGQFGWTSYDAGKVDQLIQYVDMCKDLYEKTSDKADFVEKVYEESKQFFIYIENVYNELKPIIDQLEPIYKDIIVRHEDIIIRHEDIITLQRLVAQDKGQVSDMINEAIGDLNTIRAEAVKEMGDIKDQTILDVTAIKNDAETSADKAAAEAVKSANSATASEVSATASETSNQGSKGWYDKSYELYEELQKGNVYRGTWNPHTNAYPDNQGTNSTWDVILNEGELEYDWNGTKWFWGDRLVYIKAENKYQQIESGTSVSSVNGKKGAVLLTYTDVQAAPEGFGLGETMATALSDMDSDPETWKGGATGWFRTTTTTLGMPNNRTGVCLLQSYNTKSSKWVTYLAGNDIYTRFYSPSNGWGVWSKTYSDTNKPTPTDVGALSLKGGTMEGSIRLNTYALQGFNGKNILRDHGNGNVTLAASANGSDVPGDLYLGYNSTSAHVTRSVRLESPMTWKGGSSIVNTDGNLNSENMYGPIRTEQDSTGVWHTVVGGTDAVNRGRTIVAAGEVGKKLFDNTSSSAEDLYLGAGGNIFLSTTMQGDWVDRKTVKVQNGEMYAVDGSKRVYHEGFKPTYTASDVKALPISGGTLTGNFAINPTGGYGHRMVTSSEYAFYQGGKVDGDTSDQKLAFSGYNGKWLTATRFWMANKVSPTVRWGNTDYQIYHEGFKPAISDILPSDIGVNKTTTLTAPSGVVSDKYYPILFNGTLNDIDLYISTQSASGSHSMNNNSFKGFVRSGANTDRRSYATGQLSMYDSKERAIYSIVERSEGAGNEYVVYVAGGSFPVTVITGSSVSVTCTGKDVVVGSGTFKAGISGMTTNSDYGEKVKEIIQFDKGPGFYTSGDSFLSGGLSVGRIKSRAVISQDYNEQGAFITRRAGVATYSMVGQATNGDTQIGTGVDSNTLTSYLKVAPNKLAYSPNASTEYRVYHEGFKPTASELGAVAVGDFGVGGRQGKAADAREYTEGKTLDFNDLITAGEYGVSGSWVNGPNNTGAATSWTAMIKVEVRHWPAGLAYLQTFKYGSSGAYACKVRHGTGTHPNITWTPWVHFSPTEIEAQYRICIDRPGEAVYPYMTLHKREVRQDLTSGWYTSGLIQFKMGVKSDENNPDSGKHQAAIRSERSYDNSQNRLVLQNRKASDSTVASEIIVHENRASLVCNSKTAEWDGVSFTIDGKKVFHEGFKPTLEVLGITGKSMGYSQALGSSVDLNDYKTPGVYHQSANAGASSGANYPEKLAGSLIVYQAAGVIQEYRSYNSSRVWSRAQYSSGAWTPWAKQYNTENKPSMSDVIAGNLNLKGNKLQFQDGSGSVMNLSAKGNGFEFAHGINGENRVATLSVDGSFDTTGAIYSRVGVIAQSRSDTSWLGLEAPETGNPYLSFKTPSLSSPVIGMRFNGDETEFSQRVSANEFRVGSNAGLKFSPFSNLGGVSWGIGMDAANGNLGIHRYSQGVWQAEPMNFTPAGDANFNSSVYSSGKVYAAPQTTVWGGTASFSGTTGSGELAVRDGDWIPLIGSCKTSRVGSGYSNSWFMGHYRTPGNNGDTVLAMVGDGLLTNTLRYHFTSAGAILCAGTHNGSTWSVQDGGYLYGSIFGAYAHMVNWCNASFAPISDVAYKRNIKPATKSALEDVSKIDFISYDWDETNPLTKSNKSPKIGVTAQQMEEIDACYTKDIETFKPDGSVDTNVKSLDVANMLALALKAIQEQQVQIELMQTEIIKLKEELNNV